MKTLPISSRPKNVRRRAFTLVELLTTMGIIALLVGILTPAISKAVQMGRVTRVKGYLETITFGLETFRKDMGYYPDSSVRYWNGDYGYLRRFGDEGGAAVYPFSQNYRDTGAHRLAEALFGLDQLGFSEYSPGQYRVISNGPNFGKPTLNGSDPIERKGPYVSTKDLKIGTLSDCHPATMPGDMGGYVLNGTKHGEFNDNPLILDNVGNNPRPILYYKANIRENTIPTIYNVTDNFYITGAFGMNLNVLNYSLEPIPNYTIFRSDWPLATEPWQNLKDLRYFLWDRKTGVDSLTPDNIEYNRWRSPYARPYNPDSFILWSAGLDNIYGTADDLTNFTRE